MGDTSLTRGLLILPRLQVQNVNIISAPATWGFPSITAFLGLMWALERRVERIDIPVIFNSVGIVCHSFEPQVTEINPQVRLKLTRNPLTKEGKSSSFVEEGRGRIDVTIIFGIDGGVLEGSLEERKQFSKDISETVGCMRVAGGSILPNSRPNGRSAEIISLEADGGKRVEQFRRLRRRWLPGFTLVARDELLAKRAKELCISDETNDILDAWLDISRLNYSSLPETSPDAGSLPADNERLKWHQVRKNDGWIVPIPVGYAPISGIFQPGEVANTRDIHTPFQFVESVYSVGQWISPHRLTDAKQLLWYAKENTPDGIYRCYNDFSVGNALDFPG